MIYNKLFSWPIIQRIVRFGLVRFDRFERAANGEERLFGLISGLKLDDDLSGSSGGKWSWQRYSGIGWEARLSRATLEQRSTDARRVSGERDLISARLQPREIISFAVGAEAGKACASGAHNLHRGLNGMEMRIHFFSPRIMEMFTNFRQTFGREASRAAPARLGENLAVFSRAKLGSSLADHSTAGSFARWTN